MVISRHYIFVFWFIIPKSANPKKYKRQRIEFFLGILYNVKIKNNYCHD